MKNFKNYVSENGNDVLFEVANGVKLQAKLTEKDELLLLQNGKIIHVITSDFDLQDFIEEKFNTEIRICTYCGGVMQCGYTDEWGDFYNHEECFPKDMDERYGKGNWRSIPENEYGEIEENHLGGYYEYREDENSEWVAEPSFYTEWY